MAKHLDINRVEFSTTLWHNVVLPAISHACGTWFQSSKCLTDIISALQYKCAKAAIRVAYFLHVKFKMDSQRLPAILLKEIMSSNCNYYKDINEIFNKRGLDFVYTDVDLKDSDQKF